MSRALLLLLIAVPACSATVPRFAAPVVVPVQRTTLSTDISADPFFSDWNNDGMSDFLVDWTRVPEGKGRIYRYVWTRWMHQPPIPLSYLPVEETPSFTPQVTDGYLTAGLIANPCLSDWNGDGLNDLIVGQLIESRVRIYPNHGTNQDPVFTTFSYLVADDTEFTAPYT